jgi:hypothetical protein
MRLRAGKITGGGPPSRKGVTSCRRTSSRGVKETFASGEESRFVEDDVVARGKHRGSQKVVLGLGTREAS